MTNTQTVSKTLENLFQSILKERMHGVPILNRRLGVEAVGFCKWNQYWLGVMLTPWFMNLLLLPDEDCEIEWDKQHVGSKHFFTFPAGEFEFIVSHEASIGRFLMSSLFSPVFEFGDQETALITAETVMAELFAAPESDDPDERDEEMRDIWEGKLPDKGEPSRAKLADNDKGEDRQFKTPDATQPISRRELLRGRDREAEGQTT